MKLGFSVAAVTDAAAIMAMRNAVADSLTVLYGQGHWSHASTERGVLRGIKDARVVLAKRGSTIVGSLTLATKKPWAIDAAYFTPVPKALYLLAMTVDPRLQRSGVGRACLEHAAEMARAWPAQAIRLDAYDAPAGAGAFYAKCGYREVARVSYRGTPLVYFEMLL